MSHRDDLEGIGGWLILFLVSWGVITPLGTVILTRMLLSRPGQAVIFEGRWDLVQALIWSLAAMTCVACWVSCWRLVARRDWNAVRLTIAALCFMVLQSMILTPLIMVVLGPLRFAFLVDFVRWNPWHAPLYAAICIAFLLLSKRVRRIYRADGEEARALSGVFE